MEVKIVGEIKFKTCTLPVYRDLDEPLFKAGDVAELMDYGPNNIWNLTTFAKRTRGWCCHRKWRVNIGG